MGTTTLTFAGDSADAVAAIARLERKYVEMESKIRAGGKKVKDDWAEGLQVFSQIGQSITGIGSSLDIAKQALSVFKAEYKDFLDMQKDAATKNIDFGKAFTDMMLNNGVGDDPKKAKARLLRLSAESGVAPQDMTQIMNTAQASKGGLSDKQVDENIVSASKLSNLSPESMKKLVGSSLDVQKAFPKATPQQAQAFVLNSAAESHVENASDYATNMMPGVMAIAKQEKTGPEYPAAVGSALTQASGDPMGRKTRTALLALDAQLAKALPELPDLKARIEYAQKDKEFFNAFFEGGKHKGKNLNFDMNMEGPQGEHFNFSGNKASFETQSVPFVKQALTADSQVAKDIERIFRSVPALQNSGESYEKRRQAMQDDPNIQVAQKDNEFKLKTATKQLENTGGADESVSREGTEGLLKAQGIGWGDRRSMQARAWVRSFVTGTSNAEGLKSVITEAMNDELKNSRVNGLNDERRIQHTNKAAKLQNVLDSLNIDPAQKPELLRPKKDSGDFALPDAGGGSARPIPRGGMALPDADARPSTMDDKKSDAVTEENSKVIKELTEELKRLRTSAGNPKKETEEPRSNFPQLNLKGNIEES